MNTRQAIWLAAALALGLSCNTFKRDEGGAPPGVDGATYEAAPPREVIDDGGLVGVGGGRGGDASFADDQPLRPDLALPRDRAPADLPMALDVAVELSPGDNSCDLLMQDCPLGRNCYPGPSGRGICQVPQTETSPCTDDVSCPAGRVCVDLVCTPLCNTGTPTCTSGERCMAYPMIPGVGYCVPGSGPKPDSGF